MLHLEVGVSVDNAVVMSMVVGISKRFSFGTHTSVKPGVVLLMSNHEFGGLVQIAPTAPTTYAGFPG